MRLRAFQEEAFTKVWDHFIVGGGEPSHGPPSLEDLENGVIGPDCLYRGPSGVMCSAGLLIPDKLYHKSFEGCTADEIPLEAYGISANDAATWDLDLVWGFMLSLQSCHDEAVAELEKGKRFHEMMRKNLTNMAELRGFKIPAEEF